MSTTSLMQPFSLLLFGNSMTVKHIERKIVVDDWIEVKISAQVAIMFRSLKNVLSHFIKDRMTNNANDERASIIVDGICRLLMIEALDSDTS